MSWSQLGFPDECTTSVENDCFPPPPRCQRPTRSTVMNLASARGTAAAHGITTWDRRIGATHGVAAMRSDASPTLEGRGLRRCMAPQLAPAPAQVPLPQVSQPANPGATTGTAVPADAAGATARAARGPAADVVTAAGGMTAMHLAHPRPQPPTGRRGRPCPNPAGRRCIAAAHGVAALQRVALNAQRLSGALPRLERSRARP